METSIATPVDYAKLMAEAAAKAVKDERAPSSFISFKSGILTIDDQHTAWFEYNDKNRRLAILDFIIANR